MVVDISDCLVGIILDNGDVLIQQNCAGEHDKEYVLGSIEQRIDALNGETQQLHLVRDLLLMEERMDRQARVDEKAPAVKRVYNNDGDKVPVIETAACADCDDIRPLVASQWGKNPTGDLVCTRCESLREHEYGIPPVE
jgi:hypothetical protein